MNDSQKNTSPKEFSPEDKARLSLALGKVCEVQKSYGKVSIQLETMVDGFLWFMNGYSMQQILDALEIYVRSHSDIPAPADLIAIITPPELLLDREVYRSIKKRMKEDVFVSQEERDYCRAYERQQIEKWRRK